MRALWLVNQLWVIVPNKTAFLFLWCSSLIRLNKDRHLTQYRSSSLFESTQIVIRFGSCGVQRLTGALKYFWQLCQGTGKVGLSDLIVVVHRWKRTETKHPIRLHLRLSLCLNWTPVINFTIVYLFACKHLTYCHCLLIRMQAFDLLSLFIYSHGTNGPFFRYRLYKRNFF